MSRFDPGLDVRARRDPMGFEYGTGVFGPAPELRRLEAIRPSLRDPGCEGPDPVYAIVMDVGREEHREALRGGTCSSGSSTYAAGRLGEEPVRSQGHVHRVAPHSGWSPPELYEIWSGRAVVYMQEHAADDPGRCFAIDAGPGEVVVVPPGLGPRHGERRSPRADDVRRLVRPRVRLRVRRGAGARRPRLVSAPGRGRSRRLGEKPALRGAAPRPAPERGRTRSSGSSPASPSTARSRATRRPCSGSPTPPASRTCGRSSNRDAPEGPRSRSRGI